MKKIISTILPIVTLGSTIVVTPLSLTSCSNNPFKRVTVTYRTVDNPNHFYDLNKSLTMADNGSDEPSGNTREQFIFGTTLTGGSLDQLINTLNIKADDPMTWSLEMIGLIVILTTDVPGVIYSDDKGTTPGDYDNFVGKYNHIQLSASSYSQYSEKPITFVGWDLDMFGFRSNGYKLNTTICHVQ